MRQRGEKPIHIPEPESFEQWPYEIQKAVTEWPLTKGFSWELNKGIQDPILLVLPLPPSANRYWRTFRGIHVRSQRADDYIEIVHSLCQMAGIEPLTGDLSAIAHIYRDNAARDLNNCTKVLYDAIQGYVMLNDNQICNEHHIRDYDSKNPRVVLFVSPAIAADTGKIKSRRKRK